MQQWDLIDQICATYSRVTGCSIPNKKRCPAIGAPSPPPVYEMKDSTEVVRDPILPESHKSFKMLELDPSMSQEKRARSLVCSALYVGRGTRPDGLAAIQRLTEACSRWSDEDEALLRDLLGFLKGQKRRLYYQAPQVKRQSPVVLTGFSDATYTVPVCRSGKLVLVTFDGISHVIDFCSKKQRYCSLSSGHSECISLMHASRDILELHESLKVVHPNTPNPICLTDSQVVLAAIRRGFSRALHSATRQLSASVGWMYETNSRGDIVYGFEAGSTNPSDALTKTTSCNDALDRLMASEDGTPMHVRDYSHIRPNLQPEVGRNRKINCFSCGRLRECCVRCKQCRERCGCVCQDIFDSMQHPLAIQ